MNPTSGANMPPGTMPNGPTALGPEPTTSGQPTTTEPITGNTGGPVVTTSFDPLSGTGFTPGSMNPTGSAPPPITNPVPPTGNAPPPTTTGTMDPTTAGNQALFATIQNMNLQNQLQGLLVAGLFQDGSVKLSPIDGQWHLYADAIQQSGTSGVQFYNATQVYNQPNTLNYQVAKIIFNQPLPANPSAYTVATQTAFQGDTVTTGLPTAPAYYATSVDNYRSNTVDYVDVIASGGNLALNTTSPFGPRYYTAFNSGQCTVNGTTLWTNNNGVDTYLGGQKPTLNYSTAYGSASSALNNTYANGTYLGRQVIYFDPATGQIATAASVPAGVSPQQYFSGTYLVAQDTLYSNLFTHGPIMSFGSSQSRIFGGIDSIVNDQDALSILNGAMPVGMPDGLFHS